MMTTRSVSTQNTTSQQPWPGRSNVAIFVRCLYLLDLDLLEDWPGVTEQVFTAKSAQQNLQHRVKAIEWSLYRLFELYDPDETKDKLRPFFPPATQLQSLNLRAALYRCLTELKKNGVLGKDALLRKTMLDDCKGDRFEEIIANFAMIVLKKSARLSTLLFAKTYTDSQLLPIVLAYRRSLQNTLRARNNLYTETQHEQQRLHEAEVNLKERLQEAKDTSAEIDPEQKRQLRSLVNSNWIGDQAWTDILLRGTPPEILLEEDRTDDTASPNDSSRELLRDLDSRISRHQSRLLEWKIIAKDLKSQLDSQETAAKSEQIQAKNPMPKRFLEHRHLNLGSRKEGEAQELSMDTSYMKLLQDMRQEMAMASKSTKTPRDTVLSPESPTAVVGESGPSQNVDVTPEHLQFRPESRSVESSPVPSEHSGYSEQIDTADDGIQPRSSPTTDRSDLDDHPWILQPHQPDSTAAVHEGHHAPSRKPSPTPTDSLGEPRTSLSKMWMSLADRTRATMSLTGQQSLLPEPDSPVRQTTKSVVDPAAPDLQFSSDEDRSKTLLERTRKSMSLFASTSASRSKRRSTRAEKPTSQLFPINQFETPGKPRSHLQTQTAAADWLAPNSGPGSGPGSRASTPRDKLFDEDAEYASVFKSRPKIALSPAFSPKRASSVGLDSILEREFDIHNDGDTDEEVDVDYLDLESD